MSNNMFKQNRHKGIGIGGIKCHCCKPYSTKKEHRRVVRSLNKKTLNKIITEHREEN